MNTAQYIGYPLLIIAALELSVGLLILRKNPRNSPVNKSTAACAFAAAAWSFSTALMYIRFSQGLDHILFARLSWVGWFTVPTALQTVLFLGDEQSRKARIAGMVLYPYMTVILGLCLFTDLIVTKGYIPLPFHNSPGPLEMPARLIGSLMAFWLIAEIVLLRRRVAGFRRSQLSYYLYGTIIFGMGGAVIGGVSQVFTGQGIEPSLSAYFSLPWVLMIVYAITRYRLFDIRLILSRTIAILFLSFCISALQFSFFKMMEPVVGAIASIFISVPIIGILFFGTPLSRSVQQWINDLVLGDRYLYQKMLRQSANAMITILDRDELLRYIVESVRTFVGVKETSLYLRGADGSYSMRHCGGVNETTDGGWVLPQIIVTYLASRADPIITEEFAASPSAGTRDLLESVLRVEAEIVLPLASKGQLLGVLTLGQRASGVPYLPSDIETLQTVANHAAVAIENAQLFEDAIRARASQRESEQIFRSLAESTSAAIFILRGDRIIYANPASARMSGYSINELLAVNPWSIIHDSFRDAMIERSRILARGQQIAPQFEFKFTTRQGDERWAITTSAAIELDGAPAVLATMVDVTDIKRSEEERARLYELNEEHYRERIAEQKRFVTVLDAASDGFWICGADVRFTYVNDAYCRMLGYSRDELVNMSIKDVEMNESPEMIDVRTRKIAATGNDVFETRHRRKDGTFIDLEITVTLSPNDGTFFSFGRDITERKKAEAEKARILKDLHDGVGGLTTNINLLAEIALTRDDLGEVRRALSTIVGLSRESLSEIRSFLQSLDVKDLTWQAVAAELRHLGRTIIEPHAIAFSLAASLPEDDSGPNSVIAMNLFRIFKESLANIVKHARATSVEASLAVRDGKAVLEVQDNGIGLGVKHGSGRGLLNMQSRAAEMAGVLSVTAEKGTRICLQIPLH